MDTLFTKPGRLAIVLGTAAFLVALPVKFGFNAGSGMIAVKSALALASSDDGDDDHSGSGGSSHDDDDDNSGSGSDDDSSDDSSGSGSTGDTGTGDGTGAGTGTGDGSGVQKIEVSSSGVEVTFSDGTREEIENGRYERKDASGQTVEERAATQADLDRLLGLR